ncbi:hypothetical protein HGG64_01275 [Mycoplasma phocoeninasale]|uniref:Variable surface lipoprotein n=1 Tax=Mycoplasma phocoeninasale TaxID=2726117 RepID=A0A858U303_9MOLU|nr:hypothetical protein [Mycoplasma phocoeninasale]QJG66341.1 hypothetical protein HGG64_01275 [Mycoplasma phocoeninasale]
MKKKNFKWWVALPATIATLPLIAAACDNGKAKDNPSNPGDGMKPEPDKPGDGIIPKPEDPQKPSPMNPDPNKPGGEMNMTPGPSKPGGDMNNMPNPPAPDTPKDMDNQGMMPQPGGDMNNMSKPPKPENPSDEMNMTPDPNKPGGDMSSQEMNPNLGDMNNKPQVPPIKKEDSEEVLKLKREIWYFNLFFLTYDSLAKLYNSGVDYKNYKFDSETLELLGKVNDTEHNDILALGKKFIEDFRSYKNSPKDNGKFKDDLENVIVSNSRNGPYEKFLVFTDNIKENFVSSETKVMGRDMKDTGVFIFLKFWNTLKKISDPSFYNYLNLYQAKDQLETYISKRKDDMEDKSKMGVSKAKIILDKINDPINKRATLSPESIAEIDSIVKEIENLLK